MSLPRTGSRDPDKGAALKRLVLYLVHCCCHCWHLVVICFLRVFQINLAGTGAAHIALKVTFWIVFHTIVLPMAI